MAKVVKAPRLHLPKHIENLTPYKPGKPIRDAALEYGISTWVKLASNENPLGVSTLAKQAAIEAMEQAHFYPHPRSPELIEKLSKKLGKKNEEIVCTNGVDSLLGYIIMAFTYEGDEVLTSDGSFIGIYVNVKKLGRSLQTVPLHNYGYDLEALSKAVTPSTKIVYLSNPNNPTGSAFNRKQWQKFFENLPPHVLVVLDEAYYEYACFDPDYPNGLDYPLDRLIVTRTFSKAYGMADFRVGYGISSAKIISEVQKVKLPFEPSSVSSRAAAAALDDVDFLQKTQDLNRKGLEFFLRELNRLKVNCFKETRGNFVMLLFPSDVDAHLFAERCLAKGLILRPLSSFGIPGGVRMNTGTMEENSFAIRTIEDVIKEMKL